MLRLLLAGALLAPQLQPAHAVLRVMFQSASTDQDCFDHGNFTAENNKPCSWW